MSYSSADLRKLAGKKRSRNNLEEVQSALSEMEEMKDSIESWLEKVQAVQEGLTELLEQQDEMDPDLIGSDAIAAIASAAEVLRSSLPEEGGISSGFSEYYNNAASSCEDLESQLEDRDYDAETRDETWGEVTDNLVNMADALDEISALGTEKPEQNDGE